MRSEQTVFEEALRVEEGGPREAFLAEACGGDAGLRRGVEALLAAHAKAGGILDRAPRAPGTAIVDETAAATADGSDALLADHVGVVIGRYKLLERLGEGGMGAVYMADQEHPVRRKVAVKVIKPGMDSAQVIARFEAERQALALMDHPNIARVLDAGTTDAGRPYFVMELVRGVPITEHCDRHRLPVRQRLELFAQVCRAVQHAHTKGVIHRDLKPSNVLVTLHDGAPVPKVIDFGIAKATQGRRLTERTLFTNFAQMVGTPLYMSPEQAELSGLDVDTRSDVYSLGVILYELLTGTTPFEKRRLLEAAFDEVRRVLREEEPPRPSTRLSTLGEALADVSASRGVEPGRLGQLVRGELDWIVMRCLEKDRARRYETAAALAADVGRHLADEAVEACPPSAAYRLRKLVRRNRAALATAAAFAAVLVGATAVSVRLAVQATAAEGLAESRLRAVESAGKEAESARRATQDEAAVSAAVIEFLNQDLLWQASPDSAGDRDVTLRTVLDRAADKARERFREQPLVEAAVRDTLGVTYISLGEFASAKANFARAVELRQAHAGPTDRKTLWSRLRLANSCSQLGLHAEALALNQETVELQRATLGPNHADTLSTQMSLADNYAHAARLDDAISLSERTLALQRSAVGPDADGTLISMNNLANGYCDFGWDKGTKLHEETLALKLAKRGPDHFGTLLSMHNLARRYFHLGRHSEALRLREDAVARAATKYGADHPFTLAFMEELAQTYARTGRPNDAAKLRAAMFASQRRKFGPSHPDTLQMERRMPEWSEPAGPYGAAPAAMPGRVEAEDFDRGGPGIGYRDRTDLAPTGRRSTYRVTALDIAPCADEGGGHVVGGINLLEWLAYTIDVAEDGVYEVALRVGSPCAGAEGHVEFNGQNLTGRLALADAAGGQHYRTVSSKGVKLAKGRQVMRVVLYGRQRGGICTLNWIELRRSGAQD